MKRLLALVAAAAVGAVVVAFVWPRESPRAAAHAFIDEGPVRQTVLAIGRASATTTVTVGAEVSGLVAEVAVDFNDVVAAGQPLAQLDRNRFEHQLALAEAAVRRARATRQEAEARLTAARAELDRQERQASRVETLGERGFAPERLRDDEQSALITAQAEAAAAAARLAAIDAEIAQHLAQRDQAALDLERSTIRAPIDGVVVERRVSPGQTLASAFQTPDLFVIASSLETMRVEALVDEADIGVVKEGQTARFTVPAHPERDFIGTVSTVRLSPNDADFVVSYPVFIEAPNPDRSLLPGMTAQVEIETARRSSALRAPNAALSLRSPDAERRRRFSVRIVSREEADRIRGAGGGRRAPLAPSPDADGAAGVVWVDRPGGAGPQPVEVALGLRGEAYTEITDGDLRPGDRVVVAWESGG